MIISHLKSIISPNYKKICINDQENLIYLFGTNAVKCCKEQADSQTKFDTIKLLVTEDVCFTFEDVL